MAEVVLVNLFNFNPLRSYKLSIEASFTLQNHTVSFIRLSHLLFLAWLWCSSPLNHSDFRCLQMHQQLHLIIPSSLVGKHALHGELWEFGGEGGGRSGGWMNAPRAKRQSPWFAGWRSGKSSSQSCVLRVKETSPSAGGVEPCHRGLGRRQRSAGPLVAEDATEEGCFAGTKLQECPIGLLWGNLSVLVSVKVLSCAAQLNVVVVELPWPLPSHTLFAD